MRPALQPWLIGTMLLVLPAAAHAEDEPKPYAECTKLPTEAETNAAKGAFQAGNASFDEADYQRAITYWEDAYRRDCTANALLLNLARAYELYGQKRQAVVALETFLVREPATPQKDQIRRRIEALKKQIETERAAKAPVPVTTTAVPATTGQVSPPEPALASPEMEKGKKPILPLIVAGGGAVVAIVGGAIFAPAAKDVKNFETRCPERQCPGDPQLTSDANAARNREIAGGTLMVIGIAGVVGGLVWYGLAPRKPTRAASMKPVRPTSVLVPVVAPGFAGVSLSSAFF